MTDDSKMGFGLHIGKRLGDISDSYFDWLMEKDHFTGSTLSYNVELIEYIKKRKEAKNDTTGTN